MFASGRVWRQSVATAASLIVLCVAFSSVALAQAVPEPTPKAPRIEWRDGKTRITTENAHIEISNRVQFRFTQENPDTPPNGSPLAGVEDAGDQRGSFRIRRAKLKLEGWFWQQNNLTYELQVNWPAVNTGGNPGALLEDASLAWDPQGTGKFRVVLGQFKVPHGRQELTSSGSQQFVDRSLVSNQYSRGRDTGLAVQGVLFGNRIEYRAGLFNGTGLTQSANDNDTFQYNARLMWQPNGNQTLRQRAWVSGALYSEGDFESTTVPLYAVGLNFESNDNYRVTTPTNGLPANMKSLQFGLDGVFKYKGLFLTGEAYWRQRQTPTLVTANINRIFRSDGFFVQGGKMLNRARTWEAAARYGWRDANSLIDNEGSDPARFGTDEEQEMRVGLSYYYRRHSLKFQVDAGQIETQLTPLAVGGGAFSGPQYRKNRELRMQAQFVF